MEEHGLAYEVEQYQKDSASHRKKRKAEPFVKRIIHKCRVDAVIELFYFGKSTHGWYINSTNKEGLRVSGDWQGNTMMHSYTTRKAEQKMVSGIANLNAKKNIITNI